MPTHRFTPIETEAQRAVKRLAGQDLARNRDRQRPKSLQELHQAQLPRDIKADYANTFLRGELEQAITRGRQPTQGFGPLHATPTPTSTPTLAIKPTETREGSADRPEPTRGFFNQIGEGIVGGFEKLGDEVISGVKGFGETNLDMLKGAGKTALQGIEYVDFALTMAFADDETRRKIEERTRELSGGGEDPLAMFKAFKELKEEGRPTVSPEGRVATGQGIVGAFDLTGDVLGGTTLGVVDAIGKHVMGDNFEGIIAKHMAGQNPADPMARVRAYREAKALGEIPLGVQIAVEVPDILLGAPALGAAGAKLAPILGRALKGGARAVAEDVGTLSRNLQPVAERILASERGSVGGPQLPRDLAGAKPRFNLQANSYLPEFESDVDKALYIVAQKMKSKRDADYLAFLKGVFPDLGDAEIRAMGAQVRMAVKDAARIGSPGPINIPPSGFSEGGAAFQTPEVRQALQPPAATGTQTTATGADPSKVYEFKYRVVELGDLRASHQVDFHPNRNYPQALQPRMRDRTGARLQIQKMVQQLQPDALLDDVGTLDRGPMIVGDDLVVESGNGRVLALRLAVRDNPEALQTYFARLKERAAEFGLDPTNIEGMEMPVLVRERRTPVDRVAFAAEANQSAVLQMGPLELALQDAGRLSDEALASLQVTETQSIEQALQAASNRHVVRQFIGAMPENEAAALLDAAGNLNQAGLQRIKAAMFAKVFPGEAGARLTKVFFESLDPTVRQVENALFDSLPALAKSEGRIRAGQRASDLSIAEDISKTVDVMDRLKETSITADNFVRQAAFERELTNEQDRLLLFLDEFGRSRKVIRDFFRSYAQAVENAPHPGQATLLGAQAPGKEEVIGRLINERLRDQTRGTLFEGLEGREAAGFREAAPIAPTDAQASRELAGQTGGGPAPKAARPKRVKKEATPEEPPPTSEEELTSLRAADEPGDLPPPPDEPINDGIQRLPPDGDDLVPYESIPPGERLMGDLQDAETAAEIAFSEDFWRKLVNLPYLKGIFGTLNPAAVASNPAKKVMAIRARLRHEGYQKASAAFQSLRRLGSAKEIFGPTDDFGRLTHPDFRGDTLGDVLTHPDRYDLDEIERAWVAEVHKLTDHKLDLLLRNDIDIQLLQFEEGGHFVDRRVWGKMGKNREIVEIKFIAPGPGRPGSKLPGELTAQGDATVKKRWFETEAEGVEAGYAYMDPDEALFLNMQGAYNRIADKNSFEWLIDNVPWRTTGAPEELKLAAFARKQQLNRAKQLKAALNRAVRGERLPPQTIKSIGRSFPREAEELNQLIPLIQKEADTAARVQALDDVADGDILVSQMEFNAATSKRAQARADAMELRLGEARVQAPIFSGKILTGPDAEETAQLINQGLNPQYSSLLADINMVQDVARFMLLTGDYSPATIQLLFLMGSNPVKYRKALAGMVRSTFDEKFIRRYLTENNQVYQRPGSQLIVPIESGTEFTAAAARGGLLQHPVLAPARAILTPFARAFNGAITVAVTEQAKSLDDLRRLSASNMDQVDNFTNEMMGLASSARISVSPLWRQVESITILASRYNRAIAALLFDVFRGNLRGHLARRALGKGIGAVVAATVAISAATGDDIETIVDRLNPASPNFMTWDVNGQRIGPGSKVRSVMKLLADSMTEPDRLIEFTMENPGLRFVRGNLAPVIRSSLDLLNGRDYLGDKTRDSVLHFFENIVAPNLMPIWVQGTLLEGGDLFQRGTRGAAEFAGFRAYPQSPIAKYISYVEQQTGAKYEDLTREQRKEFKVEDARGRELWEEFLKDQEARGRDNKTLTMIRGFREDRTTELEEAVDATKAGTITWPELRGRIQETGAAMAAKVEGLENDPSHAGNLEELRQTPDDELPPDEAYRRYNEIIHDPELDQVDGFDFDIRDRRVQEFRNLIGEELWATVMENLRLDRADYPPEVQQYYQDQETVKPYWKVGQDYRLADARVQQIWEQWLDSTQVEKQVLQRKNPGLSAIIARLDAERERMRRQNPEIDVALVRWRGYRPKTREGANLYKTLYVGEEAPQAPGQPSTPRSGLVRPRPPSGEIGKQIEDFIKAQQLTPTPQ